MRNPPTSEPLGPALRLWRPASGETLAVALAPPTVFCVEESPGMLATPVPEALAAGAPWLLSLSLTTVTAYHACVARTFVAALAPRCPLHAALQDRAETALQEAVSNAILHGNLGLPSISDASLEGLAAHDRRIEQKLRLDEFRRRQVFVAAYWFDASLLFCVGDEGKGCLPAVALPAQTPTTAPSGRGRWLLDEMSDGIDLSEQGRCTWLRFAR